MNIGERLGNTGVVPVVALDKVEDAVPTAKALVAGGANVMEITFRTGRRRLYRRSRCCVS